MNKLNARLMALIVIVTGLTVFGQGPLQKRIDFSINSPYAIRMGDYLLPAGNYVLRQTLMNDPNLFSLYPEDLTNEPIAQIRTTRIDYSSNKYPEDTKVFVETGEGSAEAIPVLQGWVIPGLDGWEVISVVEKKSGVLSRLDVSKVGSFDKYRLGKSRTNLTRYEDSDRRSKIRLRRLDK